MSPIDWTMFVSSYALYLGMLVNTMVIYQVVAVMGVGRRPLANKTQRSFVWLSRRPVDNSQLHPYLCIGIFVLCYAWGREGRAIKLTYKSV